MAKSIFFFIASLVLLVSSACAISDNPAAHSIYVSCALDKYSPNTVHAQNLDQLLASINNSALYQPYNNFTTDVITALYQCRGNISMLNCTDCVQEAVSQLRWSCLQYLGGVAQMEGCSIKYDNYSFLGEQGTNMELSKCGPPPRSSNDDRLRSQRDAVLDGLMKYSGDQSYKVSNSKSGNIQSMAQCSVDLSPNQCQDCVSEAIRITKQECNTEFAYGNMFLNKFYVRYWFKQSPHKDGGISKTATIFIVIMAILSAEIVLTLVHLAYLKWVSINEKCKIEPSND